MKVIFIPGNGGGGPKDNWFPYLKEELEKLKIEVIASEFPDQGHFGGDYKKLIFPELLEALKARVCRQV